MNVQPYRALCAKLKKKTKKGSQKRDKHGTPEAGFCRQVLLAPITTAEVASREK